MFKNTFNNSKITEKKKYFDIFIPQKPPFQEEKSLFQPLKTSLSSKNKFFLVCFFFTLLVAFWGIFIFFTAIEARSQIFLKTEKGYLNIKKTQESFPADSKETLKNLKEAEESFQLALLEIKKTKKLLFPFSLFSSSLTEGERFLKGAILFSRSLKELSLLYKKTSYFTLDKSNPEDKIQILLSKDKEIFKDLERGFLMMKTGRFFWESISEEKIPPLYKEKFSQAREDIKNISYLFSLTEDFVKIFPQLLGKDGKKRYLLLLENNNELRPGGGFIGTYGIWEFENGRTTEFWTKGVSFFDYQFSTGIKTSYPLSTVASRFKFMDSNIHPDFATSAQLAENLYEKFTNEKIDGVFAFTPTFVKDLLEILGPIFLPEYNMKITADNFFETIQLEVEAGIDKQNYEDPKQVLYLFIEHLLDKIYYEADSFQYLEILKAILENLSEKHILFYFENPEIQKVIEKWNFGGKVKEDVLSDYLMIVNWNLGGLKSSLFVKQKVKHKITIKENGEIEAELSINRLHTKDYFYRYYDSFSKKYRWLVGVNKNYMKIYLPEDIQVLNFENISNIDYYSEFKKKVLGFWFTTNPLEEKEIKIKYKLPFKIENLPSMYNLVIQKQPGDEGYDYVLEIESQKGILFSPSSFQTQIQDQKMIFKNYINSDIKTGVGIQNSK